MNMDFLKRWLRKIEESQQKLVDNWGDCTDHQYSQGWDAGYLAAIQNIRTGIEADDEKMVNDLAKKFQS